jgi:putative ABC transport system permease protein
MIAFLTKGIFRDRSRSMFPIITVAIGAFLTVLLYSYIVGVFGSMIETSAKFSTGHVKIMTQAYSLQADRSPNDLALFEVDQLLTKLNKDYPNFYWTPRIKTGGLLDIPDKEGETLTQGPAAVLAVDLLSYESKEIGLLNLPGALLAGKLPTQKNEILISAEFAKNLGVFVGETATLFGSTIDESMSMTNFKISGLIRFGIMAMDRSFVIMDISAAQEAINLLDGASEILGFSQDGIYSTELTYPLINNFNEMFSDSTNEFSPLMISLEEQQGLGEMLIYAKSMGYILIGVFLMALALVLWNSGLRGAIRRYGEVGIRLAMGEAKGRVYRSMIIESVVIGILGSLLGTVAGLACSYYLQIVGLDLTNLLQNQNGSSAMMMTNIIRAKVTPFSYFIGFFPGIIAPVLGTMLAGVGIYRRQTARLFKELEV